MWVTLNNAEYSQFLASHPYRYYANTRLALITSTSAEGASYKSNVAQNQSSSRTQLSGAIFHVVCSTPGVKCKQISSYRRALCDDATKTWLVSGIRGKHTHDKFCHLVGNKTESCCSSRSDLWAKPTSVSGPNHKPRRLVQYLTCLFASNTYTLFPLLTVGLTIRTTAAKRLEYLKYIS